MCCSEARDSPILLWQWTLFKDERSSLLFFYYNKWYPVLRVNNRKDKYSVGHASRHRTIKLFSMKNLCLELHTYKFPVALCVSERDIKQNNTLLTLSKSTFWTDLCNRNLLLLIILLRLHYIPMRTFASWISLCQLCFLTSISTF